MTNYKEIIRLHSLGLNKTHITESCGCARSTVITALHKAEENGLSWNAVKNLGSEEVARKLYPCLLYTSFLVSMTDLRRRSFIMTS